MYEASNLPPLLKKSPTRISAFSGSVGRLKRICVYQCRTIGRSVGRSVGRHLQDWDRSLHAGGWWKEGRTEGERGGRAGNRGRGARELRGDWEVMCDVGGFRDMLQLFLFSVMFPAIAHARIVLPLAVRTQRPALLSNLFIHSPRIHRSATCAWSIYRDVALVILSRFFSCTM